jgi:hypothetical protein
LKKSDYLQQLDAADEKRRQRLKQLLTEFRLQPPLGWCPNATIDEWSEFAGVWVLVHTGNYCQDYTVRGPMILVDDTGSLYRTSRRLRFKNGRFISHRHITDRFLRTDELSLDELRGSIRMLEELLAHERHHQEREESTTARQQA